MLNKDTLISQAADEPHIWLTVGEYEDSTRYGYSSYFGAGNVSRKPYWLKPSASLVEISTTIYGMRSLMELNDAIDLTINVDIAHTGDTAIFIFKNEDGTDDYFTSRNALWWLSDKKEQTLPVWFNPPRRLRIAANNSCLFQEAA